MLVGLVSDTHDNAPIVRAAVSFLREQAPDLVVHAGDVTAPRTVALFAGLPCAFLRGNNDDPRGLDPALARHGFEPLALDREWELAGVRVAAHHGHLPPHLTAEPDVLIHGHSHQRRVVRVGRTLVVNPGALYRVAQRTIALIELPSLRVRFFEARDDGVRALP